MALRNGAALCVYKDTHSSTGARDQPVLLPSLPYISIFSPPFKVLFNILSRCTPYCRIKKLPNAIKMATLCLTIAIILLSVINGMSKMLFP